MLHLRHILVSLLVPAIFASFAFSREVNVPSDSQADSAGVYQASTQGLRLQLQDILAAAKDHNRAKLESLTKQTQIPHYEEWFTTTFGQEKGESWAEPYGRDLVENQKDFENMFMQMAGDDGEIYTRKVNDNPGPPGGMEAGMIKGLQGPIDFFFASWKRRGSPQDSKGDPIGYFVFLDGKFRWDSTIYVININSLPGPAEVAPPETPGAQITPDPNRGSGNGKNAGPFHPGVGGVTYPACSFCPYPEYTREARAKHIEGIVVLTAIIQPNGRATDIVVVKSPDPGLTEKAIESVSKWRFKPARGEDKEPVPVIVPIEVTFRLLN
jgi:periplasmic protein TonB